MSRIPEIVPITDLRQDSSAVLKRLRSLREPIIITQRGRAAAVMLSVEEYERTENERQILLLLARGEKEIAQGKGHTLDNVLAEADRLLAGRD
jgi:prevent-host-death family protein